jgi:hypothetical protein
MIAGLAARLPPTLYDGLTANGVPSASAERIAHLPPVGSLFAAFLGYNPIRTLLGPAALEHLSPAQVANLTGTSFFPRLIAEPVPARPGHRVPGRAGHVAGRRGRVLAARRPVCPRGAGGPRGRPRGAAGMSMAGAYQAPAGTEVRR